MMQPWLFKVLLTQILLKSAFFASIRLFFKSNYFNFLHDLVREIKLGRAAKP